MRSNLQPVDTVPYIWCNSRCIYVLATETFEEISVTSTRTHGRDEEAQLSSGWILIGSEEFVLSQV